MLIIEFKFLLSFLKIGIKANPTQSLRYTHLGLLWLIYGCVNPRVINEKVVIHLNNSFILLRSDYVRRRPLTDQ